MILAVLLAIILIFASVAMKQYGLEKITLAMHTYKWWGLLTYFLYAVLCATVTTFPIVPLWPFLFLVYGFWPSIIINILASITGATLAFFLTRKYGKRYVQGLINKKFLSEIDLVVNNKNSRSFIMLRAFADSYYDIVSYAAGLSRMSCLKFISVTLCATTVWSVINFSIIAWALTFNTTAAIAIISAEYMLLGILGLLVWKLNKPK